MKGVLTAENIVLNADVKTMHDAIQMSGCVLLENGYIRQGYIDDMFKKEEEWPSYIGYHIAIPHGFSHSAEMIIESGVCVLQIPNGFLTDKGETVNLVFGIAGINDEHINVLGKIALICSEEENIEKLIQAKSVQEVLNVLQLDGEQ